MRSDSSSRQGFKERDWGEVLIRQGFYELSEPLVFGPEDSGSEQFAITYAAQAGENVILSGGKKINGWKHGEGEIWMAAVPRVAEGKWYFRNLFVDGKRAVRARSPNLDAQPNCLQLKGAELTKDLTRFTLTVAPGVLGDWHNVPRHRGHGCRELGNQPQAGRKPSTQRPISIVLAPPHQIRAGLSLSPQRGPMVSPARTPANCSTNQGSGTWSSRRQAH